ncbi:MAG: folate-binding protein [Rhodospirillaceae bacterium]|nr:folate-binding protein [Rhodospirillaceae bacterium]
MSQSHYLLPDSRGVLKVAGEDRYAFLQGLVSNDVMHATTERAIWAAFLTPQGKYLHDFFIAVSGDAFLLDCEADRRQDLLRRLSLYKLRSKVTVADANNEQGVALVFGERALETLGLTAEPGAAKPFGSGIVYVDPRLSALGARAILPRAGIADALRTAGVEPGNADDYDRHRIALGVPDGSRDLKVEKAILLENGFNELHGIDWDKGCYMGQELTARTHYRGLVRKRLMPVNIEGPLPAPGTPVMLGDKEAGETASATRTDGGAVGLAMIRIEYLDPPPPPGSFVAGEAKLTPLKPDWAKF